MENLPYIETIWRIGSILIAAAGVYTIVTRLFGASLIAGATLRGRKHSTARTPPRSVSPNKKSNTSPATTPNHASILPPQRRHTLADLQCKMAPWRDVSEDHVRDNILPMSANYKNSPSNMYTPTGFSMEEIKGLGDFPNYATLSGVPLPSPYPEFDITKALPRPYRPFRWAYHQTMCELNSAKELSRN